MRRNHVLFVESLICSLCCWCVSVWWRYRLIAVLPGHQATINLHLSLAVPSHRARSFRGPLAAHNNTQNAAGPCQAVLICGYGPGVEFSRRWLLDLLYSVGGLATSFSLHAGQRQWADTQPAITQQERPAQTHTHSCMCTHTHTYINVYGWIDGKSREREAGEVAAGRFEEDLRKRERETEGKLSQCVFWGFVLTQWVFSLHCGHGNQCIEGLSSSLSSQRWHCTPSERQNANRCPTKIEMAKSFPTQIHHRVLFRGCDHAVVLQCVLDSSKEAPSALLASD